LNSRGPRKIDKPDVFKNQKTMVSRGNFPWNGKGTTGWKLQMGGARKSRRTSVILEREKKLGRNKKISLSSEGSRPKEKGKETS